MQAWTSRDALTMPICIDAFRMHSRSIHYVNSLHRECIAYASQNLWDRSINYAIIFSLHVTKSVNIICYNS